MGVLREWRKHGLGLALLRHSFDEFYRRGAKSAGLGVDAENLTGATRLYEIAGMRVWRVNCTYEFELRAGKDLMRQNLRRNHPAATDAEIDRFLREWLLERPGAESGDCSGRPVDVTSRLA